MSRLHDKQILFADINEKNLMVDPKNYTPFFIDTDSYQFNDFITPVATPGYLAPEIDLQYLATNKRTNEHEYFALAVLFFYLINSEIHPFSIGKNPEPDKITEPDAKVKHLPFILEVTNTDPNYYTPKIYPKNKEAVILWQLMPQNLRNLFAQSFAKPPIKRPKPSEFASALGEFTNKLEEDIKNLLLNNAGTTSNHNLTTAKNLTRQATKIPNSGQTQLYQQYALQKIKQNKIRTYLVIGIIIILVSIILILITMNDNHPQDNYSSAKEAQTNQTQQIQNQQEDIKILPPQIQHKKHKPHEYKTSLENNTNNSDDLKTISRPKPTNTKPRIDNQNNYNNSLGDM
jgi:hypothetical protein